MALRLVQIAVNARNDSAVGRFWAEALGWGVSSEEPGVTNVEPVGFVYPDPAAVCIDVLAVPEPKTVKNRVHIDLATTSAAHQADLVARLRDLGATPADGLFPCGEVRHARTPGTSQASRGSSPGAPSPDAALCAYPGRKIAIVKRVLLTGMSGTGKSSVIRALSARGFKAVDTDDGWCEPLPDGRQR